MMASASPPFSPAHIAPKTSRAILLEIVPSMMRPIRAASAGACTGESAMLFSSLFKAAATSPMTQFAASLAWPAGSALATAWKYAARSRLTVSWAAS
ncbi:hypothetical protein D3C73_1469600 [compost metagenome]